MIALALLKVVGESDRGSLMPCIYELIREMYFVAPSYVPTSAEIVITCQDVSAYQ